MGKTRNTGKLATQIQFDNSNNLVIGNSTSSSFNTSGSVNATGGITGSIYGIGDPTSFSASISSDLVNLESKSASVDISINNINSFTASNGNTSLNAATSSYSKLTGGNTFTGTQIVSASVYIQGDLVVQGSSSIQYISASSVSIGTNIVQLNTATPAVRFGGLSVQDSGSSAGVTGSMLWDSCCNRWIYSNPSGVGYSGGVLMSGPRASTFGNEPTLTCNYIAKSGGGDHLYDSCIWEMSGSVGINTTTTTNLFQVTGTLNASSGISRPIYFNPTIAATANGDCLIGLDINPTYTNGAFTGLEQHALRISCYQTFNSQARIGGLEFQSYALGNAWIGENVYYDGSNFKIRQTGCSGMFYFYGNEGQFRLTASNAAGTSITCARPVQLKTNSDGSFAVGSAIDGIPGVYTGAKFLVNSSGIACFACQICAPSFIGGTLSGTTIYGSTTVCSPIGLFSGCVGIGTTSPSATLHIVSPVVSAGTALKVVSDGNSNDKVFEFTGVDGVASQSMYMFQSGNVGIGTATPSQKLEVAGVIRGEVVNVYGSTDPASTSPYLYSPSTGALGIGANGSERMRITNSGVVCFSSNVCMPALRVSGDTTITGTSGTISYFPANPKSTALCTVLLGSMTTADLGYGPQFRFSGTTSGEFIDIGQDKNGGFVIEATDTPRLTVTQGGFVGIGTNSPGQLLTIKNPTTHTYMEMNTVSSALAAWILYSAGGANKWLIGLEGSSDNYYMYNTVGTGGYRFTLTQAGVLSTTGGGTSDCRVKHCIQYLCSNTLPIINQLKPVSFIFNEDIDKQTRHGFIAQDVLNVKPDLVLGDGACENGTYGLDYDGILSLTVKAIQEQQCIICSQSQKIALLESCIGIV